ncbi:hypothetical protein KDA_56920 [Dictyobacter alpinus]|uniref:Uncharacterized protein n=1 Tax=Dictyobacter alpinus TaxID=2014873 RepID=A0A402BFN5_9CHLR|nr:hypothetical protein [Dictyobacter alpinus]GCE30208.1 hypothetical protein KDA_56920 [Dictyobacter alpinus]
MTLPTLDQTEGIWIGRTQDQGYHYIQDIFPNNIQRERYHQDNCFALITRGSLQPEQPDGLTPIQRTWERLQRYRQVL